MSCVGRGGGGPGMRAALIRATLSLKPFASSCTSVRSARPSCRESHVSDYNTNGDPACRDPQGMKGPA